MLDDVATSNVTGILRVALELALELVTKPGVLLVPAVNEPTKVAALVVSGWEEVLVSVVVGNDPGEPVSVGALLGTGCVPCSEPPA